MSDVNPDIRCNAMVEVSREAANRMLSTLRGVDV